MVEFIKTCDQYPCKFNFGHIFSSIVLPHSSGEMGNFLLSAVVMIKTWERVLPEAISKQILFFDSQMYFQVILTP